MGQVNTRRGSTRSLEVYEEIRSDIMATRIPPGARLKAGPLCERFGVSLSVVREALTRLSEQRLVRSEPQLGFSVLPLDRAGLEDLTGVRVEIETLALRWAIGRADLSWETSVVAALHRLGRTPVSEPGDQNGMISEAWSDAHCAFHTALASGCGSPLLMELRRGPYDSAEIYRRWARPGAVREERDVHKEHTDIADAAIARDAGLATSLLEAHIRQTTKTLLTSDLMNSTPD
ncbi:GntR family transcriptional regulator [Catenulispora sp. NF23]|uniref:GntR family transcriptional regulator n=1 Tax=Catenulispora pinistramenti TaxID=2705254 RepID=UPI001BA6FF61|nr:GntR family transcriptional regulator [Catenulispora pinistramenti]MBS2531367.1 GntR family transcriptional regulator [Catenulispora pinistramenti]